MIAILEKFFKWVFALSLLVVIVSAFYKDTMPGPSYYESQSLNPPAQSRTYRSAFTTEVNGEIYQIEPKYSYELEGVVVSYHDADVISDIYHHDMWKDYLNLRDICVIWGDNVRSAVYQKMQFENTTWTCWAYWPDRETGKQFSMQQLSNNHILSHDEAISSRLLSAEVGDYVRMKGLLVDYRNPASGFNRKTSTVRNDTGNGACETIYLEAFEVVDKANSGLRQIYSMAWYIAIVSLVGFLACFALSPVR